MRSPVWIFGAMIAGALTGILLGGSEGVTGDGGFVWFCDLLGTTIFIGALKMIVAPLIFFSILAAIVGLPTRGELWRVGWRTFAFYFATTSIAVSLGLLLVLTIQPGLRGDRDKLRASWGEEKSKIEQEYGGKVAKVDRAKEQTPRETIVDNLKRIIQNPFQALADMNSLGIIFFAILLGIALVSIGEKGVALLPVIESTNAAILEITHWIMKGAPLFIYCLVTALLAKHGTQVFGPLAWYVVTVIAGIAVHVVVLLTIGRVFGKIGPGEFLRGIRRPWAIAFATRSSAATLPVTIDQVQANLGVPRKIADFVLPIGATINMDGTALYEGVAVIFLIQLFGGLPGAEISLGAVMTVVIFLTAVLASIGAAAVPDAGLITMVLVANAVGLDAQYIGLIFAVDAFLDMFRTSTNVMGDAVGSVVITEWSGAEREPAAA